MKDHTTGRRYVVRLPGRLGEDLCRELEVVTQRSAACRVVQGIPVQDGDADEWIVTTPLETEAARRLDRASRSGPGPPRWIVVAERATPSQVQTLLERGAFACLDTGGGPRALARRLDRIALEYDRLKSAPAPGGPDDSTILEEASTVITARLCREVAGIFDLDWLTVVDGEEIVASHLRGAGAEQVLQELDATPFETSRQRVVFGRFEARVGREEPIARYVARSLVSLATGVPPLSLFHTVERAKQAWEATVDAITDPIALADQDGFVLRANKAFARLAGRPIKEVAGCSTRELGIVPNPGPGEDEAGGVEQPERIEIGGRWYEPSVRVLSRDREGRILLYLRDVTETMRLTALLIQRERYSALGELAEGVFHDLNNLTSALKPELKCAQMSVDALRNGIDRQAGAVSGAGAVPPGRNAVGEVPGDSGGSLALDIDELAASLDAALLATRRLEQMLSHLRQYARLRHADREGGMKAPVDINHLLRALPTLFGPRARHQGVVLHLDLAPVPLLDGRPGELMRLFENLMKNALDAMPGGGAVHVTTCTAGPRVRVTFEDTGQGVPADVLPRIFDKGFSTRHDSGGTGLGLYLCKGIVDDHGGAISVKSTPGRGSIFGVEFPLDSD